MFVELCLIHTLLRTCYFILSPVADALEANQHLQTKIAQLVSGIQLIYIVCSNVLCGVMLWFLLVCVCIPYLTN